MKMIKRDGFLYLMPSALAWLLLSVATVVAACNANEFRKGEFDRRTLTMPSGLEREFIVYVPTTYEEFKETPVFFNYHGFTNPYELFCTNSGMSKMAEENNFIAVCPAGVVRSWNGGDCCGTAVREDADDVGFTQNMQQYISDRACVDKTRVFGAGYSNGGFFMYKSACQVPSLFTAFSNVAGSLSSERTYTCDPESAAGYIPPLIHIHGQEDRTINYENSLREYELRWTGTIGKCTEPQDVTFQNGSTTCRTFQFCGDGSSQPGVTSTARFCSVGNNGHGYPGCVGTPDSGSGCEGVPPPSFDIFATQASWDFFMEVTKGLPKREGMKTQNKKV